MRALHYIQHVSLASVHPMILRTDSYQYAAQRAPDTLYHYFATMAICRRSRPAMHLRCRGAGALKEAAIAADQLISGIAGELAERV